MRPAAAMALLIALGAGEARAVTITCDAVLSDMCGEYTVPTEQEAVPIWETCQKRGGSPSQGAQCRAAPACTQKSGDMSVKTYDYHLSAEEVRDFCGRTKGEYSDR